MLQNMGPINGCRNASRMKHTSLAAPQHNPANSSALKACLICSCNSDTPATPLGLPSDSRGMAAPELEEPPAIPATLPELPSDSGDMAVSRSGVAARSSRCFAWAAQR
ncbi:hypothetical protein HGM15179_019772 [Zosterops borbonicus]|uniref:Uncharacterized protein n=1 Tax=Zosterops borbonicus TaxID=364589 RepID=A0A8K1D7I7_9PASS|nr:hypothetical protein HGM15179_019772 [Zosterops borbonicus]